MASEYKITHVVTAIQVRKCGKGGTVVGLSQSYRPPAVAKGDGIVVGAKGWDPVIEDSSGPPKMSRIIQWAQADGVKAQVNGTAHAVCARCHKPYPLANIRWVKPSDNWFGAEESVCSFCLNKKGK